MNEEYKWHRTQKMTQSKEIITTPPAASTVQT